MSQNVVAHSIAVQSETSPSAPSKISLLLVMIFAVLVWSINYTVAKIGLAHVRPLALASFRIVTAGIAMLPVAIYCAVKQKQLAAAHKVTRLKSIQREDLWNFACLGFFGVFLNQGIFTYGLSMTSVGHSSIIVATTPIGIMLAAWLQRLEGLNTRKVIGLAVAFLGALVIAEGSGWNFHSTGSLGDLLTFCSCMSVVIFTVLSKKMAKTYDAVQLMAYNVAFAGVFALPIAIWQGAVVTRAGEWSAIGWQGWGSVLYMGVLSSAVCISLYFWALRWLPPSKVGAFSYMQPIIGAPFAAVFLGEPLTRDLISGGALILAGVYVIESDKSEKEEDTN
jgi:drug/metabolite transporter (DMT)-like permease